MDPNQIWTQVVSLVRQTLAVPTAWLAMQAVKPLTIDGNYFVAALPRQEQYLAIHLQDNQTATAIEDALQSVTGRILAFRLINGETLADWEAQKAREANPTDAQSTTAEPPPAFFRSESSPPPVEAPKTVSMAAKPAPGTRPDAPARAVSPSWEKLNERLASGYKTAPFIKYPHGQAHYVVTAVKLISDTMDVMMPPPGAPRDDAQERMLTKVMERLGSIVNLDPMFLSLELWRYRESQGKSMDIPL